MIFWLNQNSGAVIALLTFFLILVTAYYAWQTNKQATEAKELRELQYQPRVYAEFALAENKWAVMIHFKNLGGSVATDIELVISPELKPQSNSKLAKINVPSLAPGQTYDNIIGYAGPYLEQGIECVKFSLNYKDTRGKDYNLSYEISMAQVLRRSVSGGVGHEEEIFRQKLLAILREISEALQRNNN